MDSAIEPMPKLRLNMGAGRRKLDGFLSVDVRSDVGADVVMDLSSGMVLGESYMPDQVPAKWPWPDDSVELALFQHSLEHMAGWSWIFRELFRVCAPGAAVEIHVPHPAHEDFWNDPTHVWCPTPAMLALLSQQVCAQVERSGGGNTPLAVILGVDFELVASQMVLDELYRPLEHDPAIAKIIRERNNVVKEVRMKLVAVKGGIERPRNVMQVNK